MTAGESGRSVLKKRKGRTYELVVSGMRLAVHRAPEAAVEVLVHDAVGVFEHRDERRAVSVLVDDRHIHARARGDLGEHLERPGLLPRAGAIFTKVPGYVVVEEALQGLKRDMQDGTLVLNLRREPV